MNKKFLDKEQSSGQTRNAIIYKNRKNSMRKKKYPQSKTITKTPKTFILKKKKPRKTFFKAKKTLKIQ